MLPQEKIKRTRRISNNRHLFVTCSVPKEAQTKRGTDTSNLNGFGNRPSGKFSCRCTLFLVHPIYGPGEIACNANLLVMPLSLGQEGGPTLVAPIKGCWSTLLHENLHNKQLLFTCGNSLFVAEFTMRPLITYKFFKLYFS